MLEKYKYDLLHGYEKIAALQAPVVYREINNENGYEENYEKDGGDIVIDYIQFSDGYTVFAVIPELTAFIKDFSLLYTEDLFSLNAFLYLFDYLETYIRKYPRWLYKEDNALEKYMIYYGLGDKNKIIKSKIQQSTIQCTVESSFLNLTNEYKKFEQNNNYFGTLIDNNIVAISGTNGMENEIVDIGVDTNINHRRKGYAVSNITALSAFLLNKGYLVKYSCNSLNMPSMKTAVSSGFDIIAKSKTIWCPSNKLLNAE